MNRRFHAFTLVELLVVISIITLLVGILLPVLGKARESGRTTQCLSNMHQWGICFSAFVTEYQEVLPYDGEDDPGTKDNGSPKVQCYLRNYWWANALPLYMNQPMYRDLSIADQAAGKTVPLPGDTSFYLCPSAVLPDPSLGDAAAPFTMKNTSPVLNYFFNYVMNSKLNKDSTFLIDGNKRAKLAMIPRPANTVYMIDMRSTRAELPVSDPNYATALNQGHGSWTRLSARHSSSGSVVFGDAHAALVKNSYAAPASEPSSDFVVPSLPGYNQSDLIWTPASNAE